MYSPFAFNYQGGFFLNIPCLCFRFGEDNIRERSCIGRKDSGSILHKLMSLGALYDFSLEHLFRGWPPQIMRRLNSDPRSPRDATATPRRSAASVNASTSRVHTGCVTRRVFETNQWALRRLQLNTYCLVSCVNRLAQQDTACTEQLLWEFLRNSAVSLSHQYFEALSSVLYAFSVQRSNRFCRGRKRIMRAVIPTRIPADTTNCT